MCGVIRSSRRGWRCSCRRCRAPVAEVLRPVARLFVLGNASIDTTLNVPRLPAAGETLMATGILRSPGGKGLNQAVVAARAGASVHFCAPLGIEPETALVRDALAAEGLAGLVLHDDGPPPDLSTLLAAPAG